MKKYNSWLLTFRDYNLTSLMTTNNGKKKDVGDNYNVYTVLSDLLLDYGIHLCHCTKIRNSDIVVRSMILDKKFPIENFEIIEQCYGYNNAEVDICLERNDSCEYSFLFNTETKSCTLEKHVWGEVEKSRLFNSFAELWAAKKGVKNNIEKLFI